MRKKLIAIFLSLLFVISLPAVVIAQEYNENAEIKVTKGGSYFISGDKIKISEDISNDVFAAGSEVVLDGAVEDNLFIAGGGVLINGDVNGDIYAGGGYIIINGNVEGDVRAAGGEIYINSDSIGGDVALSAGTVKFADNVEITGEEYISAGVQSSGAVDNPTDLSNFDSNKYNFDFQGGENVLVGGLTLFTGQFIVLGLILQIVMFVSSIVAGYVLIRLFPTFAEKTMIEMKKNKLKSILVGIVVSILAPFVIFPLMFSGIGTKLALVAILLGMLALYFGSLYATYEIGRMFMVNVVKKKNSGRLMALIVGFILVEIPLMIIALIPIIGFLITLILKYILYSWGVGAIVLNKYSAIKMSKK